MKFCTQIPPELEDKEAHETCFHPQSCVSTIVICLVFWALVISAFKCSSQTIGLGLGYASDGRTTAKLYFVTPSGFGAYVNHYADAKDYVENSCSTGLQYAENPITCLGITGRIHQQVVIYAGAGKWHTCKAYNDAQGYRYYDKSEGTCIEAGATMELFRYRRFAFHLDASINSTGMVNSMILISVKP